MQETWEVEQKYIVDNIAELRGRLATIGARESHIERQVDTYLAHPARNFRLTDEAFRVRRVNDLACVTYKGPRFPGSVKTRSEIELRIDPNELDDWMRMLEHLGFGALPAVRKERHLFELRIDQREFRVAIDDVELLGSFAEIELMVRDKNELSSARLAVESLGNALGLDRVQSKSYLSQLLVKLGHENQ